MVEFGLKLQDNRVAEWSDHYISYEQLKALLKKAKQAQARYEELSSKRPELAEEVKSNFEKGISLYVTGTPPISTTSLTGLLQKSPSASSFSNLVIQEEVKKSAKERQEQIAAAGSSDERESLLGHKSGSFYGSEKEPDASVSSGGIITRAVSSVSGYLEKRYEATLRECLKEIDRGHEEFDKCLMDEVEKVNKFYDSKLDELEHRFLLLEESVAQSLQREKQEAVKSEAGERLAGVDESKVDEFGDRQAPPTHGRKISGPIMMTWQGLVDKIVRKNSSRSDDGKSGKLADVDDLQEGDDQELIRLDPSKVKKIAEADSIQRALVDQYRTSKLLHNFAIMNYTGFVKIAKKHDKTLKHRKGRFKTLVDPANICNEGKLVEALATRLERRYATWFCDGDIREAYAQLLPKRGDGLETDWSQLRLGYRMGMCAVLGIWVCWDCVWGFVASGQSTIGGRAAFPVFRACGGLLLLQWFWGCSVFVWTRYRVNYIYLFDFDPRIVSSPLDIFGDAVDNTLFFLLCMLLYYKSGAHDIPQVVPSGAFPLALALYTILQLIFPLRVRMPMWKAIWQVVTSPATSPSFFLGYVGDIFTSMVKVFQDIAWTICFILSGDWKFSEDSEESARHAWAHQFWYKNVLMPIICLLPLIFRFNQCLRKFHDTGKRWPHLANASKYALSQTVTLFGAFHPLYLMHSNASHHNRLNLFQIFWMFVFVASSLYSFSWDVLMDWGLGRKEYGYLGPRLMYPKRIYYFYVIGLDLILRFMWVLTLLPPQSGAKFEVPNYLNAMVMMFELFRRTIWGFLRLENEHRSNTAGFRRVSFVPLHFNTGHNHKYQQGKEHRGKGVLVEVAFITCIVVGVCIFSVVAAQHATRSLTPEL